MNAIQEWNEWAKANYDVIIYLGCNSSPRIWIWSRARLAGLSVPIDTTPADLPALIEQKAREKIEEATQAAEKEKREGQELLAWADEQKGGT